MYKGLLPSFFIIGMLSVGGGAMCFRKMPPKMENSETKSTPLDHRTKSILARGCDPEMSYHASLALPPLMGNPEYVATTDDADFIQKLTDRKWSVVFFAPGACRFNAAHQPIPGAYAATRGWSLAQYRELIYRLQGEDVLIVETLEEMKTVGLLKEALSHARPVK